jgi:hypothetical protein
LHRGATPSKQRNGSAATPIDHAPGFGNLLPPTLLALAGFRAAAAAYTARRSAEALALVNQALPVLRLSLGPEAPVVMRLQALGRALAVKPVSADATSQKFDPFG